jgi:alanyl-tRNA synthetase
MTQHLYYNDSFLDTFDAEVRELQPATAEDLRPALILDRTTFYPTSGGQPCDTGWIIPDPTSPNAELQKLRVTEVAEREDGQIVHYLEPAVAENKLALQKGSRVRGLIDPARRRDHMQQHSGQHILSAAFVRLFNMSTVSFHMGDEYCAVDLDAPLLTREQVESAERLSN